MADDAPPEVVDLGSELRALYAREPADFVAARTELVRRLRAAKRRDEAAAVAKRRRPSPTAWALDRVAVRQPDLIEGALAAGARLRAATEAAMAGDATALRTATAEDRAASEAVVTAAARYLGDRAAAVRTQLTATLRTAVLDDEVAAELREGVLATDHEAPGFGWSGFEAMPDLPVAPVPSPAQDRRDPGPASRPRARAADASQADASQADASQADVADIADIAARAGRRGRAGSPAPTRPDRGVRRQPAPEAGAGRERDERERERREREEQEAQRARVEAEAEHTRLEERAAELAAAAEQAEEAARRARAEADAATERVRRAREALGPPRNR